MVRPDGALRVVHSQGDVTWDESGRPLRQFGVMQDITELQAGSSGELRASEARFRTFVDHALDAFSPLRDEQLEVVDVNRQACEKLGFSREELIGMRATDFDAALDERLDFARCWLRARRRGWNDHRQNRHRRKDGTVFPVGDPHGHSSCKRGTSQAAWRWRATSANASRRKNNPRGYASWSQISPT